LKVLRQNPQPQDAREKASGVARVFVARSGLKNVAPYFAVKIFETLNSETVIKL